MLVLKTLHNLRRLVSTTLPETLTRTWSAHPSPRMTRNQIVASTILLQHICFVLSNIWCSSIKILSEFSTNFPKTQLNILQSYYDCPMEWFSESAGDWPSFMYEENDYNPGDLEKGLLRGYTIVRVSPTKMTSPSHNYDNNLQMCQHIFTAPSSALLTVTGRRRDLRRPRQNSTE